MILKAKKTRVTRRRAPFTAKQNSYDDTGPELLRTAFIGDTSTTQGCERPTVITRIDNRIFGGNKQT